MAGVLMFYQEYYSLSQWEYICINEIFFSFAHISALPYFCAQSFFFFPTPASYLY